eukprot:3844207-Amphidinium_carterae.4
MSDVLRTTFGVHPTSHKLGHNNFTLSLLLCHFATGPAGEDLSVFITEAQGKAMRLCRSRRVERDEVLPDKIVAFASMNAAWLEAKHIFKDLTQNARWWAVPHPLGVCHIATFAATDIAGACLSSRQLLALEAGWRARHEGIRALPRKAGVPLNRYSPCLYMGHCVCQPGYVRTMTTRVSAILKANAVRDIVAGDIVLQWRVSCWRHANPDLEEAALDNEAFDATSARNLGFFMHHTWLYSHVAVCNLRPFRPVFAELELLPGYVINASNGFQIIALQQVLDNGQPKIFSIYEFFEQRLPQRGFLDVKVCKMSSRQAPIQEFCGQAFILVPESADTWQRVWSGTAAERVLAKQGRGHRKRTIHEMFTEPLLHPSGNTVTGRTATDKPCEGPAKDNVAVDDWEDLDLHVDDHDSDDLSTEEPIQELITAAAPPPKPPMSSAQPGAAKQSKEGSNTRTI